MTPLHAHGRARAAHFAFVALVAIAAARPGAAAPAGGAAFGRALDDWARPLVERGLLSGNLLVAHRDSVVLERSWGMADSSKGLANAPDVPSCVASINKPMTMMLFLQLRDEGRLAESDPLSKWIPGFPRGDRITLGLLLQHRSGIPHRVTTDAEETRPQTAADLVVLAAKAPLLFEPGTGSAYSSAGYSVLARVLELASGRSYGALLRERLLDPLGMQHTFDPGPGAPAMARAVSYEPVLGGVRPAPFQDLSYLVGAGAVFSTPRDLHRLLWAAVSGRLGANVRAATVRGAKVEWNGSTDGYRAFADCDTATGDIVIFAGNLHCGAVDQLRAAVEGLLAGRTPEPPRLPPAQAARVSPALLRSYEGLYDVAGNPRLAVRATPSGLDANGWELVATSDSTFFSLRDFATVRAVGRGGARIERFDWMVGGRTYPCPRVGDLP